MYHLLILTDNTEGSRKLVVDMRDLGYTAVAMTAQDLDLGLQKVRPDLAFIDFRSYGNEGLSTIKRTLKHHAKNDYIPIIVLTDQKGLERVGIDIGVDDFVLLPYHPFEVEARIKHVLWRANKVESRNIIRVGDLVIDLVKYETRLDGEPIDLTFKEYELLRYLAMNRGKVFTRESLLDKIWGYDYYGGMRTVDVHIRRLRAKLDVGGRSFIKTIRNVGYKLETP
ncbi:MAG: response regulator transcription factor [Candidatus Latescibacteria bacterium]|nr:response regulator transcription factor [Candidatus Latescibacterota bacterium]